MNLRDLCRADEPWKWAVLLTAAVAIILLAKVLSLVLRRYAQRLEARPRWRWLGVTLRGGIGPAAMAVLGGAAYYVLILGNHATSAGGPLFVLRLAQTMLALAAGWYAYCLVAVVDLYMLEQSGRGALRLGAGMRNLVRRSLRTLVLVVTLLLIAQNVFQWDIAALITGLGITGLAVALAAQQTLANFFGSLVIYADRPFELGDLVKIRTFMGKVADIGFRSTVLLALDGTRVVLPNALVASEIVENLSRRPCIRRQLDLIVLAPQGQQVEQARQILERVLASATPTGESFTSQVYVSAVRPDGVQLTAIYFLPPEPTVLSPLEKELAPQLMAALDEQGIKYTLSLPSVQ